MEGEWFCSRGGLLNGGGLVASLIEGEYSCYGGGQFKGHGQREWSWYGGGNKRRMTMLEVVSSMKGDGLMVMLQRLSL